MQSFEDLMELAEKGNMHNVHEYFSDIASGIAKDDSDNYYSDSHKSCHQQDEEPDFLYGKCQFKDIGKLRVIFKWGAPCAIPCEYLQGIGD